MRGQWQSTELIHKSREMLRRKVGQKLSSVEKIKTAAK
jgi:hypothetical protein